MASNLSSDGYDTPANPPPAAQQPGLDPSASLSSPSSRLEPPSLPQVMEQPGYAAQTPEGMAAAAGEYSSGPASSYSSFSNTAGSPSTLGTQHAPWPGGAIRKGSGSDSGGAVYDGAGAPPPNATAAAPRFQRPTGPMRTPSNTYNPPRGPPRFIQIQGQRRSTSNTRWGRNAEKEYPAHENVYVRQLRQDPADYYGQEPYTPSLGYSSLSDEEDESPSSEAQFENDYDQDTQLFYNSEDLQPSAEELEVPENRERLEWYSMLASVLRGDVVKQEKQRLIGANVRGGDKTWNNEIWLGVRAKVCGRSVTQQKVKVEGERAKVGQEVEAIINFKIKGESETGKTPAKQIEDVVDRIEHCERQYPARAAFEAAHPRAASDEFRMCCAAVTAWHNTTVSINTELGILQKWVGNEELDFTKGRASSASATGLTDDASFIDRILKEDGLTSLQGKRSLLVGAAEVILKAKASLVAISRESAQRHLPPYIEELLTLIEFPSRLIQEVIRVRVKYARRMKETSAQQPSIMTEQIIQQFQILLRLAIRIKLDYVAVSQPEPGWELPPCIDEHFDATVLAALKFYFTLLNQRLAISKNTFKETEILEQEWEFCNDIGRHLENGDVEVAEQFSGLTAKALARLTQHFERELQRRPEEEGKELDRRYKTILDSVRVRQRKLFRFSRLLGQRFENATEYSIGPERAQLPLIYAELVASAHFMISTDNATQDGVVLIASSSLRDKPRVIQSILGTSSYADSIAEEMVNTYVLIVRPEQPLAWEGEEVAVDVRPIATDIQTGRIRLVSDGSQQRLFNARSEFIDALGLNLGVVSELRANLPRVNAELTKIKRLAYKLSKTILDSVGIIRKQTRGLENGPELIQTCFAFAAEFGKRSLGYMGANQRMMNNQKLLMLALDWVSFVCDDCEARDRKTFRWAVVALEFALAMTRGSNILSLQDDDFTRLRAKVAGCMSLLISHFDIMGARGTIAAQAKQREDLAGAGRGAGAGKPLDPARLTTDLEASAFIRRQWCDKLAELDRLREDREAERRCLGRVLQETNEADRSLTSLSSSATNVNLRWQQGAFVGGGTFGTVYAALNLDSGQLMAVKEIRLQDPHHIPTIAQQIREEMAVLEVLDHPNIVEYYGIEVHRDKVYIFMEFCSGGSLATLLEHGRIEDETVTQVYALQMLEGLAHLHSRNIVHRDIKPESTLTPLPLFFLPARTIR